jgi:hypothetical protein
MAIECPGFVLSSRLSKHLAKNNRVLSSSSLGSVFVNAKDLMEEKQRPANNGLLKANEI